jgi:hypothetical protein
VIAILAATLALAAPAPEGKPSIRATATPSVTEVALGGTFSVEVEASGPPGIVWTFPDQAGNDDVEIRAPAAGGPASSSPPAPGVPRPDARRYDAAVYALNDVQLPPITVKYRLADGTEGETVTAPVPLRVLSVLPKDPKERKLADIRGPLAVPIGPAFWGAAGGALALAAAAIWLLRRRRRPEAAPPAVAVQPPDAEARAALDRLAASEDLARGAYRAFYIALAEVAKRYLERRLDAPVLEMTSSEMLAFLGDHPHGRGLVSSVRDLATAADHVKFARGAAAQDEARRHLGAVRQMIDALEGNLRPSPSGSPGEKVA